MLSRFLVCCLSLGLLLGCTPKATAPAAEQPTTAPASAPKPKPDENLSPCKKFSDAPSPDDAETEYVIYRQMLKAKEFDTAFERWKKVYEVSPAADGRRPTVYSDGVVFYNRLIQQDPSKREEYGQIILELYEESRRCYPGNGYMSAIQGFDSYYTYKGTATDDEIFALFRESMDIDGPEKLQYFVINPMSSLTVQQHKDGKITDAEAKTIVSTLQARLKKGLAECEGTQCQAWNTINDYAPGTLRYFETVKGFYDCNYFVEQYYPSFQENPNDCDAIRTAYSLLRYGGCTEGDAEYDEIKAAYDANCRPAPSAPSDLKLAFDCLENSDYDCAIDKFKVAAEKATEAEKKGRYLLYVAKVYYSHKRNFSQARAYARQAAQANPASGEPYLLIGTLYASSGPLCGPGTGFDSQIVTWPAIDKWRQAKRIQPDLAGEANKLIGRYTKYMPSKADIFQRGLKEGD
ncbi:MAG: hypothetical protein AAF597_06315, partial [Bacteroidota bacterium]